ncbi:MAG TPA: carbohydrate kinase [Caldimonas sp.]|jgi:fructokinase|nr:carbohydrate kinase [Caldimonas sp.]
MTTVLVCGEALMDVFALGDTATGMALEARIGGSPLNVAIGLARLGRPVAFFGAVSRGFLGDRLMRALREEGVDTAPVARVDAPTTLGLVGLDAHGVPSYSFYGEGGADRQLLADALRRVPAASAAIHVGSFTTVVEPAASTLRALVEREHGRALISYDPNVRLNVEPELARWRGVLQWMLTRAHVVKISEEDLGLLCPGVRAEAFMADALTRGVRLVVVTSGAQGAWAATPSTRAAMAAVPVAVVDTVGAGDTFQAALLCWLADNDLLAADALTAIAAPRLEDALRFACTAAGLTCARRGADLPNRAELERALATGQARGTP